MNAKDPAADLEWMFDAPQPSLRARKDFGSSTLPHVSIEKNSKASDSENSSASSISISTDGSKRLLGGRRVGISADDAALMATFANQRNGKSKHKKHHHPAAKDFADASPKTLEV